MALSPVQMHWTSATERQPPGLMRPLHSVRMLAQRGKKSTSNGSPITPISTLLALWERWRSLKR